MKPVAVIFDWGGVLIDDPADRLSEYCSNKLDIDIDAFRNNFIDYIAPFQTGKIEEKDLWDSFCKKLRINTPRTDSLWKDAVRSVFRNRLEMFYLITELRYKGIKTGFLSNTEIPAMEYFYETGCDKYFDVSVFSCREGYAKPDELIYKITLDKLNVEPHEAVFIDDKHENITGAEKAGINGILFTGFSDLNSMLIT